MLSFRGVISYYLISFWQIAATPHPEHVNYEEKTSTVGGELVQNRSTIPTGHAAE